VKLPLAILEERISAAMTDVCGLGDCRAIVKPSTDPKFGDYQANGVMALAKKLKRNPRELAEEIVEKLDVADIAEPPEIAGPGFINLRLKADFVARALLEINADSENRLGIERIAQPKTIVVDFSGPNIAKQMHVGHLRSTIIGDCICRLLEFQGHKVIRQNHIGDWGLQMGMVLYAMHKAEQRRSMGYQRDPETDLSISLKDLETFYKETVERSKSDPKIAELVRAYTVNFQKEEKHLPRLWKRAREITLSTCLDIYDELNVTLEEQHTRGESAYKQDMPRIVEDLKRSGLAEVSDGAVCVFPPGFKNKEGEPLPFIIRKSDGAYLYATTDLAALRYRVDELKADAIVYVTDSRQKLHFEMLFSVARMAGWVRDDTELVHVTFGSILGDGGTPLKTRSGENVKLKELLDEAVARALKIVEEKNPDLCGDEKERIAKKKRIANAVGIGAVKYADYSNNRTSDYIFSFDKMLAMDGNTAPYMQYAYARIKSIERQARNRGVDIETERTDIDNLNLTEPAELDLAKYLLRYGEAIDAAATDYRPNFLTTYLYELAQKFSAFYTNCHVLGAGPDKRPTRLLLCDLTANTIGHGLGQLLGIEVIEQM